MTLPAQVVLDPTAAPALPDNAMSLIAVDARRRVWVTFDSGIVLPVAIEDLERIAGVVPAMSVGGNLGTNIHVADVEPLLDGSGRFVVSAALLNGIAPLMSAPGRLGVNLAVGDVSLVLGGAGQLVTQLQSVGGNNAQIDANGNQYIRDAAPTAMPPGSVSRSFSGGALVTALATVGAAGGRLMRAWGVGTTTGQVPLLFDSAAVPANGTAATVAPPTVIAAGPGNSFMYDFTRTGGLPITNGVVVAMSTTFPALTIVGAASMVVEVEYST